jgi:hypothetical protein
MEPTDPVVNIDEAEYQALVERVRTNALDERDRHWLVTILQTFRFIQSALEQKKVAVFKLRELLFGKRTEKVKKKLKEKPSPGVADPSKAADPSSGGSLAAQEEISPSKEDQVLDQLDPPQESPDSPAAGHGRRPSHSWKNAIQIHHCHDCLQAGQICPKCQEGKLYVFHC